MSIPPDEWIPRGIAGLEDAAWAALRAGTAWVAAGPGAGKSEFLAQRASYLLETGICRYPQQILAISFKRSAAANLHERVWERSPDHATRFISMTFDAFTKNIVDRFSGLLPAGWALGGPYRINFASRAEVASFLDDVAPTAPIPFRRGLRNIDPATFIQLTVSSFPLAAELPEPTTAEEWAVYEWWRTQYIGVEQPVLDFTMINRLADLIIRTSGQLRAVLSATYPFVFVDEFQDTTLAQYTFLRDVFGDGRSQVTVVGDRKQRIMGWAGALPDAFAEFENDFAGEGFELESNHRSTPELVSLQHRFAQILAPDAAEQVSAVLADAGDAAAQVWSFSTTEVQADKIAAWIAADVDASGRLPSDYALLVRQKVGDFHGELRDAFERHGLRVRNDDAEVGDSKVRLQELLADQVARLLISLVRLAGAVGGEPAAWHYARREVEHLTVAEGDSRLSSAADDTLASYVGELREWLTEHASEFPAVADPADLAARLTGELTRLISVERMSESRLVPESMDEIRRKVNATQVRLEDALTRASSWGEVADAFMEDDAVPLMTIHRSKGLEYNTVFLLGLDDDQWWAHTRNASESTMTFFVGISRAAERLIFTHVRDIGLRKVHGLYSELAAAGVPTLDLG
ncbi:UvrD-helicase domain-containing protein [Microbacterium sp. ZW T6_19]|uniref:UvrD-helicase domain-containing protein n=1 Tax=Microbacterium sp. ZW T6_19 TaxID=3378082 RepID=UPI00385201F5